MPNVPLDTRFIGIAPDVNLTERKSALINAQTAPYTMQDIADTAGGGGSYLKYKALLNQVGSDAPTATILENTLGGIPVWTRSAAGAYSCTLSGAFTADKTFCLVTYGLFDGNYGFPLFGRSTDNNVSLFFIQSVTGPVLIDFNNFTGNDMCVEIQVYP